MSAQITYPFDQPILTEGQRARGGPDPIALSFINPILPQVGTNTVGGTIADGQIYTITFTPVSPTEGAAFSVSVTRAASVPVDNTAVAAALALAINTSSAALNVVSATSAAAVVTYTMRRGGEVYTVTSSATGTGTLVSAVTQVAGGTNQRVGAACRRISGAGVQTLSPITTSMTLAEFVGLAEREHNAINGSTLGLDYDVYVPSEQVSVGRWGYWAVRVWEAVTVDDVPSIWIDPADATAFAGQFGKTVTGGKSIALTNVAAYKTSASAGGIAVVAVKVGL